VSTISFIVPTVGRGSLAATLTSIEAVGDDEVVVVEHTPPSGHWGNEERQDGIERAHGDYLAFLDDDDRYVPGHRVLMQRAINDGQPDVPILFRVQYPSGRTIWRRKWVKNGNVSAQMILVPNQPDMLHNWQSKQRFADFHFINQWRWPAKQIKWRTEVIALMGHEDSHATI
jgi:glycosyltransferase involved in cell wall biosynthesis